MRPRSAEVVEAPDRADHPSDDFARDFSALNDLQVMIVSG